MKLLSKLALAAAAIMAVTSSVQAVEKVVWWDFLTGGDGVRMKALIQKFNDSHKGAIEIDPTTLEWGAPFYTKLQTSAAIGQGPDIATYHLSHITAGVAAGTLSPINLDDLKSIGLVDSDYPAHAIDAATVDGKRYAVPFDVHAEVLYYNKKILGDAGLLDANGKPAGIDTLAGWRDVLDKVTKTGAVGVGFGTGVGDNRVVWSLFGQMGGELATNGKWLDGDNFDKMLAAYNEVTDWVSKGWSPAYVPGNNAAVSFESGQAAFMINGVWELPTMVDLIAKGQGFDYGMMELPNWYAKPASWADSHSFVIPNNVGVTVTPEKKAAVLEVIKFMNQNSLSWAGAGHIPAYLPVRDSAEYKALKPQSDYAHVAEDAFYEPKTALSGPGLPLEQGWTDNMSGAMNGDGDAKEALTKLRDYLNGL